MKGIKITFLAVCALFIIVVCLQTKFRLFKEHQLYGVTIEPSKAPRTFKNILDGSYQAGNDKRLRGTLGFKWRFVMIDNQINYSIFNELSDPNVLGRNKNIFEKRYIDAYNCLQSPDPAKFENKIMRMGQLQRYLSQLKISFLVIITPSKATFSSRNIPKKYISKLRERRPDMYSLIVPLLDKYKINYLDGRLLCEKIEKRTAIPVFPATGIHWNSYYAGMVISESLKKMQRLIKKPLVNIDIGNIHRSKNPKYTDHDLLVLTNLLFPHRMYEDSYYYPLSTSSVNKDSYLPDILLVGGSFSEFIAAYYSRHGCFSRLDFYFYFSRDIAFPAFSKNRLAGKKLLWDKKNEFDFCRMEKKYIELFLPPKKMDPATNLISFRIGDARGIPFIKEHYRNDIGRASDEEVINFMPLEQTTIDRTRLNWPAEVFKRDIIIIECNEEVLDDIGFGFIESALKNLPSAPRKN